VQDERPAVVVLGACQDALLAVALEECQDEHLAVVVLEAYRDAFLAAALGGRQYERPAVVVLGAYQDAFLVAALEVGARDFAYHCHGWRECHPLVELGAFYGQARIPIDRETPPGLGRPRGFVAMRGVVLLRGGGKGNGPGELKRSLAHTKCPRSI